MRSRSRCLESPRPFRIDLFGVEAAVAAAQKPRRFQHPTNLLRGNIDQMLLLQNIGDPLEPLERMLPPICPDQLLNPRR